MKKIKLVSVSAGEDEDSLFALNSHHIPYHDVEISSIRNNRKPLAEVYNRYLNEDHKDYIVVFVHDDVYLADGDLARKCREAAKMFDVFGVAGGYGGLNIEAEKPALWHLISKKHAGFAGHYDEATKDVRNPFTRCWMTSFGPTPQETILVDGVFLGVNVEKALQNNLRFDEACPSAFHFYDLLFCVNAKKKGMKVGVFPFNVFHQSPGLKKFTNEFLEGDLYFKEHCAKMSQNVS